MNRLSIEARAVHDRPLQAFLDRFGRRLAATPPGTCPVAVTTTLLECAASQTCGKCVPCRDGLPQAAVLARRVLDCRATDEDLARLHALAELACEGSDCAIGWEAGEALLAALSTFSDEFASHVERHRCAAGVGQSVPCETDCPAHVNVPGYVALAGAGDCAGAVALIRKDNPFPTACAFVCEHPCETRCRRTLVDAPLNIRGIKRYAVDHAPADKVAVPAALPASGRRIAVVGAGPSGLTCAYYAALMGHEVHVYESRSQLGGMMRFGIPAYRFPRERLDEDITAILSAGDITVHTGEAVDAAALERLAAEFDALYVAAGAHGAKALGLEGEDAAGVLSAVELLGAIGEGDTPDFSGKRVVVVGGGNVAMDCARTAVRCGGEVTVVYRRRLEDMTALPAEVEAAIAEGVEMLALEAPVRLEVNAEGAVCALVTQPQMVGPVRGGRPAPVPASKPERVIGADVVLVAVGQGIVSDPFEAFGMTAARGRLAADSFLAAEGFSNVFAGGDCQTGPATVIRAIAAGKVAARNIDSYLGYRHTLDCGVEVPAAEPNDRVPTGRVALAERPARERARDFDGCEESMTYEEAVQECGRCLRCDAFGCGSMEGGRVQYA
ncbi:NAD(P)-binding protein [Adlercreutzia caecimuris]|uniref:NAD(P)-binding protein n=1 Tax=Adlercreutzia caecimuris TaxID=671266 RepID=UPI002570228C|nr:NAD(P)-binding protein [Adlercreutzia caecimuris]